jgi:tRNA (guanine-N7-)-methyltransferase
VTAQLRKVRSFVRRPGRITAAQRRALDTLWPRFGLPRQSAPLDLPATFGRTAPLVLDIGFGDGEALVTAAVNHPDVDYLGIEVHEPGIGHLLLLLEQAGVGNVRVVNGDAADVLPAMLADESTDAVNLFFPDPWPKKRHHKRRLVQPAFLAETARVLRDGGLLHIASDWAHYVEHSRIALAECDAFVAEDAARLCHNSLAFRAPTKFERRGLRLGHEIVDLYYRKLPAASRTPRTIEPE